MATTGTYAFNPSAGDVTLNAFGMIGIRRTALTEEHLENAAFQAGLVGVDFTNRNPNRWQMTEVPFALAAGVPTYNLPPETVAVSAVWLDQALPSGSSISRILGPLSATEYAAIANKQQQGSPTTYFFNFLTPIPTLTLWLVPSALPAYTMRVQCFKQQQDTALENGANIDTPFRFLDAFTTQLASRLAGVYPDPNRPTREADLWARFQEVFRLAAALDQERVSLKLSPNLSSYYPR
jgi:hypothetical protein